MSSNFETIELDICVVCVHLLANGEYDDGTDSAEEAQKGITRKWGTDVRHLSAEGDEVEALSTRECETCGDRTHGTRYRATALIPQ